MIGIDTNILVRYILDDDPVWSMAAQNFIDNDCTVDNPGFVNLVVLTELVWVLGITPGWGRDQIANVVSDFLLADNLVLEQPLLVETVLTQFKNGKADFADYLISTLNQNANASPTVTIDRIAAKSDGFKRLSKGKS